MKGYHLSSWFRIKGKNKGQVAIMVAVSSFVLLGFSALSVDMGNYMFIRQRMQNALDAAALAGAQGLDSEAEATDLAKKFADLNGLTLGDNDTIRFGCFVDRDKTAADPNTPQESDVFTLCQQHRNDRFECNDESCYRECTFPPVGSPTGGCNMIGIHAERDVQPFLASILGTGPLKAGLESAACRGTCGTPSKLDVALLLDVTFSLGTRFANVQAGALSVVTAAGFRDNPDLHRLALGVIPPPEDTNNHLLTDLLRSDDRELEQTVRALFRRGVDTNLANPIKQATDLLLNHSSAREDAVKQIVLLTDGAPDSIEDNPTCHAAFEFVSSAKQQGIRVFTIGYFAHDIDGSRLCRSDKEHPDWRDVVEANELLYRMAVGSTTEDGNGYNDGTGCTIELENGDDDDFYCVLANQPGSNVDLASVFNRIIEEIFDVAGTGSRLVDLSTFRDKS